MANHSLNVHRIYADPLVLYLSAERAASASSGVASGAWPFIEISDDTRRGPALELWAAKTAKHRGLRSVLFVDEGFCYAGWASFADGKIIDRGELPQCYDEGCARAAAAGADEDFPFDFVYEALEEKADPVVNEKLMAAPYEPRTLSPLLDEIAPRWKEGVFDASALRTFMRSDDGEGAASSPLLVCAASGVPRLFSEALFIHLDDGGSPDLLARAMSIWDWAAGVGPEIFSRALPEGVLYDAGKAAEANKELVDCDPSVVAISFASLMREPSSKRFCGHLSLLSLVFESECFEAVERALPEGRSVCSALLEEMKTRSYETLSSDIAASIVALVRREPRHAVDVFRFAKNHGPNESLLLEVAALSMSEQIDELRQIVPSAVNNYGVWKQVSVALDRRFAECEANNFSKVAGTPADSTRRRNSI